MATISYFTVDEINDELLDKTKVQVLSALVDDGLIEKDVAEVWAAEHTIQIKKRDVFGTLSDFFTKRKEAREDSLWTFQILKLKNTVSEVQNYLDSVREEGVEAIEREEEKK